MIDPDRDIPIPDPDIPGLGFYPAIPRRPDLWLEDIEKVLYPFGWLYPDF